MYEYGLSLSCTGRNPILWRTCALARRKVREVSGSGLRSPRNGPGLLSNSLPWLDTLAFSIDLCLGRRLEHESVETASVSCRGPEVVIVRLPVRAAPDFPAGQAGNSDFHPYVREIITSVVRLRRLRDPDRLSDRRRMYGSWSIRACRVNKMHNHKTIRVKRFNLSLNRT
jgi:hypothetical protein